MPDDYRAAAEECGRRWKLLCDNYQGDFQFREEVWATEPVSG